MNMPKHMATKANTRFAGMGASAFFAGAAPGAKAGKAAAGLVATIRSVAR
jgi:hypothetical protein